MKHMFRPLFALLLVAFVTPAFSQIAIKGGGGLAYGTAPESIGIQGRAEGEINETWEGAANFTYFLTSNFTFWGFNADAQYNLSENDGLKFYPFAGINISHIGFDINIPGPFGGTFDADATEFGINVGAGLEKDFSDSISGFGEIKYVLSSLDGLVITAGVLFAFN